METEERSQNQRGAEEEVPVAEMKPVTEVRYIKPLSWEGAVRNEYCVKLTKKAIAELFSALKDIANKIPDSLPGGKWGYFISRNARKLFDIDMRTKKMLTECYPNPKDSTRVKEYGDKEFGLFMKYCERDEKGNAVMDKNRFKIREADNKEFEEEMKKLRVEYEDVMKLYESAEEQGQVILQEEIDYYPFLIKQESLPAGLLPVHYEMLGPFIIEEQ